MMSWLHFGQMLPPFPKENNYFYPRQSRRRYNISCKPLLALERRNSTLLLPVLKPSIQLIQGIIPASKYVVFDFNDTNVFTLTKDCEHIVFVGIILESEIVCVVESNLHKVQQAHFKYVVAHRAWPKKVQAILDMRPPVNLIQLRSFIGSVNYYHDLWPRRAHTLAPLTKLTGTKLFVWNDEQQETFETMKAIMSAEALLRYPDHNLPFDALVPTLSNALTFAGSSRIALNPDASSSVVGECSMWLQDSLDSQTIGLTGLRIQSAAHCALGHSFAIQPDE
jgi:hypothetical protein